MKEMASRAAGVRKVRIDADGAGQRVDNFLHRELPGVPRSRVYRLLRRGEVRVNGGRVRADYRLAAGDEIRIPPVRLRPEGAPPPADRAAAVLDQVLYEDKRLLVLNKPTGVAVHGGSGISHGVIELLRAARPDLRELSLVHRLDRETSGVLMIALKRRALTGLHAAMRDGKIEKRYLTLVAGKWPNPTQHVKLPLHKRVDENGEKRVTVRDDGQNAHTIFRRQKVFADFTLLEAELKTGRTHQIRVHTSHLGFPIAGDDKYGDFELNKRLAKQGLKRMFLHAAQLVFDHPISGEKMTIEAPLPADLTSFLDSLNAP